MIDYNPVLQGNTNDLDFWLWKITNTETFATRSDMVCFKKKYEHVIVTYYLCL